MIILFPFKPYDIFQFIISLFLLLLFNLFVSNFSVSLLQFFINCYPYYTYSDASVMHINEKLNR